MLTAALRLARSRAQLVRLLALRGRHGRRLDKASANRSLIRMLSSGILPICLPFRCPRNRLHILFVDAHLARRLAIRQPGSGAGPAVKIASQFVQNRRTMCAAL
jgi:hypothetical protein